MIEGSFTITPSLKAWLKTQDKCLYIDVNNKGCNGNTITWEMIEGDKFPGSFRMSRNIHQLVQNGLQLEVDYIDEPLFKRVHINILNKDKCGCGLSFNI